ncbi:MAG: M17 family peptidase N-terminal domain-containing protein, partial [Candidatus Methylomirabilales bacterium]
MPEFERSAVSPSEVVADVLVVGVFRGPSLARAGSQVDQALGGGLSAYLAGTGFEGKAGEVAILPTLGRLPAASVMAVGLGSFGELSPD